MSCFRSVLLLMTAFASSGVRASEICGLQNAISDSLFYNGFSPPAASTGLGPALNSVNGPAFGVTPTIVITSPTPGSVLPGGRVQVTGSVTGPVNTGVTVNGTAAYVHNGIFVTEEFILDAAQTQLTATATAMDGPSASANVNVTASPTPADVVLTPDVEVGFAPLPLRYNVQARSGLTIQSVSVDFQTDGTVDYVGNSSGYTSSTTYALPGTYVATTTATLSDNSERMAKHRVVVLSLAEQRTAVCAVYANVRSKLAAQDGTGATHSFTGLLRSKMSSLFAAMGSQVQSMAAALGTLADGVIGIDTAELIAVREVAAEIRGYPVHFVRDARGVWRIDSM